MEKTLVAQMTDALFNTATTPAGKFRRWLVEFKYTLQRGYGWTQVPLLGVIAASSFKSAFPGLIDSLTKFILLSIFGFFVLYFIGFLDKKYRFLHEENSYTTEVNPYMMRVLENTEATNATNENRNI